MEGKKIVSLNSAKGKKMELVPCFNAKQCETSLCFAHIPAKKKEQCTSERNISGQRSRVDRSNQAPQGTINRVSEREVARDYNKSNKKLTIKR
jgi:hypothetical protein